MLSSLLCTFENSKKLIKISFNSDSLFRIAKRPIVSDSSLSDLRFVFFYNM